MASRSLIYENPTDYQQTYTHEQVQTALAQSGLPPEDQARIAQTFVQNAAQNAAASGQPSVSAESTAKQNPSWIYAVNMPSTYPDFAAMKAAGTGLVVADNDPNAEMLIAGARQWGIPVAVNVWADPGITPEQYAAKVQDIKDKWHPDTFVLNVEGPGQGDKGSDQWNWSAQTAALLDPIVGDTPVAVSMEPHQLYNYQAWNGLGSSPTEFWPQMGPTSGSASDTDWALMFARQAGIPESQIKPMLYPNQDPVSGAGSGYVSYGIPQTGVSSAGVYGPGGASGSSSGGPGGSTPGLTPVGGNTTPGTGSGPHIPGEIPETGPTPPGSPAPPGSGLPGAPSSPGSTTTTTENSTDWAAAYFQSFGLPPDVAAKVNEIFKQHPDTDQAIQFALACIRGTQWYADTFPGIGYGMQHGLIANENDYRQYVTALDTLSQRYAGRHITSSEVSGALFQGLTPDIVGKQYEGAANVATNRNDYQYYLGGFSEEGRQTDTGLTALGQEQAGLDSPMGQRLSKALGTAMTRAQKMFEGQAATPSLSLGAGGLSAPSLLGRAQKPDVSA